MVAEAQMGVKEMMDGWKTETEGRERKRRVGRNGAGIWLSS